LRLEDEGELPQFEPVYPLTAGVTQKLVAKAVASALARMPELDEWIDPGQKAREGWPDWAAAIHAAHAPSRNADFAATAPARQRLAYDEFFAHQVTLSLARASMRKAKGRPSQATGRLQQAVLAALPYKPTGAQSRAATSCRFGRARRARRGPARVVDRP
jgi:ATP-dependent DNA helicase RecG